MNQRTALGKEFVLDLVRQGVWYRIRRTDQDAEAKPYLFFVSRIGPLGLYQENVEGFPFEEIRFENIELVECHASDQNEISEQRTTPLNP